VNIRPWLSLSPTELLPLQGILQLCSVLVRLTRWRPGPLAEHGLRHSCFKTNLSPVLADPRRRTTFRSLGLPPAEAQEELHPKGYLVAVL
jgi:hypothetical protein